MTVTKLTETQPTETQLTEMQLTETQLAAAVQRYLENNLEDMPDVFISAFQPLNNEIARKLAKFQDMVPVYQG